MFSGAQHTKTGTEPYEPQSYSESWALSRFAQGFALVDTNQETPLGTRKI